MTEQEFIEHLTAVTEKYAKAIDDAITKTSLELMSEMPEVIESSQMTALLMTAARRTVRVGLPDIGLFTALREALEGAKAELKEIEKTRPAKKEAPTPPKKTSAPKTKPTTRVG